MRVSAVGFKTIRRDVLVAAEELVVDFLLEDEEVELPDVVVYAPVIDPRRTTPGTILGSDDLDHLPLRSVERALAVSPSVYMGFVRGGRQYETKTIVEGVDVTDQFHAAATDQSGVSPYAVYNAINRQRQGSRSSSVGVNAAAVEHAGVLVGSTGTEYANATGGILVYNLHSPPQDWSVRADVSVSQFGLKHIGPPIYHDDSVYARERQELFKKNTPVDSLKARFYTYTPGKYSYGSKPTVDASIAAGRSFAGGGFYLSSRYFNSYGRLPNEFLRTLNTSLKANVRMSDNITLTGVGIIEDRGRILGWKNRDYADDFRYFLEGVPQWDGVNVVGSLKLSHILSATSYYDLQASIVRDLVRRGFSDDNGDGVIAPEEDGDFLTFADQAQVNRYLATSSGSQFTKFFTPAPRNESGSETTLGGATAWKLARPGIFYERFVNTIMSLKGDLTHQLSGHHLLKGGFQIRLHELDRTLRASYIGGTFPAFRNFVEEIWNITPREYAFYVEDRIEVEGMFLNLGFRVELLDLAAGDYADYFAPFRDDTTFSGGVVTDVRRLPVRKENVSTRVFFSPRLGASHPIGANAAMYFSFSRQQQAQPFSRLYANYNDFGNPSLPVASRTDQDPIRSTNYDLGIQWALDDLYGIDVNAYYKDIENYSTIMLSVTPRTPWRQYNLSTNFGYADARGIEVTFRALPAPVLDWLTCGGRISYAYSYIKQSVYAGGNVLTFSTAADSGRYHGQLPFDDIRSFNTIEQNVLGGNSTLTGGYDRAHRIAFNAVMRFPEEILLSAMGTFQSGFYYRLTLGDPRARELGTGPWSKRIDVRMEKGFRLGGSARLTVYVDMLNAFNWTNVLAYNTSTLGQEAWEKSGDPTGGPKIHRAVTQDGSLVYDTPREVYFGFNVTF